MPSEFYQHYKGGIYEKVGDAQDADQPTRTFTVYRKVSTGELWVRSYLQFNMELTVKDKDEEGNPITRKVKRFRLLSAEEVANLSPTPAVGDNDSTHAAGEQPCDTSPKAS